MFGIGFGELMVIAVIVLIAVGPKRLPAMMKTVGKGMREVRKASTELRRSIGVDELLQDETLRNPMRQAPPPRPQPTYKLQPVDFEREAPPQGVDIAHAEHVAQHPNAAPAPLPKPAAASPAEAGDTAADGDKPSPPTENS